MNLTLSMSNDEKEDDKRDTPLNIRLPGWLHRKAKAKAAMEGISLTEAIEKLLKAWLEQGYPDKKNFRD